MTVLPDEPAIDDVADYFDAEWREGRRPSLNDTLSRAQSRESRCRLLRVLIPIDLEYRLARGERPELSDYQGLGSAEELNWLQHCFDDSLHERSTIDHARNAGAQPSRNDHAGSASDWPNSMEIKDGVKSSRIERHEVIPDIRAESSENFTAPYIRIPSGAWRAGDLRGDYELISELGKGGMGTVFKARHCRLNRIVALKRIRMRYDDDETAIARFRREIEAIGRLPSNPHTVLATDAREIDGAQCLIMECVDGPDLGAVVKRHGPLSAPDVAEIARQAAIGLDHIHQNGLIHRDIKPSNLLVASNGMVKVVDLGLARLNAETEQDLTQPGFAMGTADYMAPEQWENARSVGAQADLYALGCTLYFLLTGNPPFQFAADVFEKRDAHLRKSPPPLAEIRPDLPPGLIKVVETLLAKAPVSRSASARELLGALAGLPRSGDLRELLKQIGEKTSDNALTDTSRIQLEQTTSITPSGDKGGSAGPSKTARQEISRSKHWLLGAGAIVAVISMLAVLFIYFQSNTNPRVGESLRSVAPAQKATATEIPAIEVTEVELWVRHQRDDNSIKHFRLLGEGATNFESEMPALFGDDDFNLRAALNRACYWRLIWLDTRGKAAVVAKSDGLNQLIRYPSEGEMVSVDPRDPSGAHLLVIVASTSESAFNADNWIDSLSELGVPPQSSIAGGGSTRGAGAISETSAKFAPDYFAKLQGHLPAPARLIHAVQIRSVITNPRKDQEK